MIEYNTILKNNLIKVLVDVLKEIKNNGLRDGNHIYITFLSKHKDVLIPDWLAQKYPKELTIVLQHEYSNLTISKKFFTVILSFNNKKAKLKIGYDSILSFADPFANFGLKIKNNNEKNNKIQNKNISTEENNIINFSNYKKN